MNRADWCAASRHQLSDPLSWNGTRLPGSLFEFLSRGVYPRGFLLQRLAHDLHLRLGLLPLFLHLSIAKIRSGSQTALILRYVTLLDNVNAERLTC